MSKSSVWVWSTTGKAFLFVMIFKYAYHSRHITFRYLVVHKHYKINYSYLNLNHLFKFSSNSRFFAFENAYGDKFLSFPLLPNEAEGRIN